MVIGPAAGADEVKRRTAGEQSRLVSLPGQPQGETDGAPMVDVVLHSKGPVSSPGAA